MPYISTSTCIRLCRILPLLAALCLLWPHPATGASFSKALPLYARDMEFYYQDKRPEVLPGILRAFDQQGVLAQGEKRLMLAAFLAEALRRDPSVRALLLPPAPNLSRDGRRTLAWAVHLAGLPDTPALLGQLLGPGDAALLAQIQSSPASLIRWDIGAEKSILQMYWGAFLASGDFSYLDAIINAALHYARLNAGGRQRDAAFHVYATAAASLYEFAPRHAVARTRLEQTLAGSSGVEADTLRTILRQP